jgi:cysteine desulfurase
MGEPVYLDYNATTPLAAEVLDAMLPALRDLWGNPSSGHVYGRRAAEAIDRARGEVASLLGCQTDEVIFTSGGTEANNAAIVGVAEALAARGRHVITSAIEHPAVERPCAYLERRGWRVSRIPVDRDGRVDPASVRDALAGDTALVTIMHANNETGVVQPIREIASTLRGRGVVLHTDAAQSVGKLPVRVDELGVDLLSVAGHKLYAPKGVGALYMRRGTPFGGFLHGAGHESGRRAGTESTPQIVGLGAACALARRETDDRTAHMLAMRDRLEATLREAIPDLLVHGAVAARLPNTLCAAVPGVDADTLLSRLDGVAAASGAACHADERQPSGVLRAMDVPDDLALCTLRLTVGRPTTAEQIDAAAARIIRAALHLRRR